MRAESRPTLCDPMDQVPLSVGFSRLEYWVAGPPPGGLRDPGVEPASPVSPALAGSFFTTSAAWRDLLLGSGSSPSALEEEGRATRVLSDPQGTLLPAELASSSGVRKRSWLSAAWFSSWGLLAFLGAWLSLS